MIEVKFEAKPIPVPLTYQPVFKIAIILAILKYACNKPHSATFLKLHLYMWAVRSTKNAYVMKSIQKKKRNTIAPWSFEPGLERAITLAIVNGYCGRNVSSSELQIMLTEKGRNLLEKIEDAKYFQQDINRIKSIGVISFDRLVAANKNWTIK